MDFDSASSIRANNAVSKVVHPDNIYGRVSSPHALWRLQKVIQRSVSFWLFRKCYCMNYWIIWKRSRIDISVYLLVDLFDELFGNEMMRLWRLSIILEFFNTFYVMLVPVNSRPVNCDSLMELGQSSTSANFLSVSRGMLETSDFFVPSSVSKCYIWSFRGVSRTNLVSICVEQLLQRNLLVETGT